MENPGGHLSRPFLGPWDNFSKSYDENQIWSERTDVPEVFLFNRDHQQVCMADLVFVRNLFENLSPGPENSLERRASRLYTIRAEIQVLKLNIDKVTAICVT